MIITEITAEEKVCLPVTSQQVEQITSNDNNTVRAYKDDANTLSEEHVVSSSTLILKSDTIKCCEAFIVHKEVSSDDEIEPSEAAPYFNGYHYYVKTDRVSIEATETCGKCYDEGQYLGGKQLCLSMNIDYKNELKGASDIKVEINLPFDVLYHNGELMEFDDIELASVTDTTLKREINMLNANGIDIEHIWDALKLMEVDVKKRATEIEKQNEIVKLHDEVSRHVFQMNHNFKGISIPEPYITDGRHLISVEYITVGKGEDAHEVRKEKILGNLCTITEIAINDNEHTDCKLVYMTEFGEREMWVPKGDLMSTNGLRLISSEGCAFNENYFKEVKDYFATLLSEHVIDMKFSFMTKRNGWKHGFKTFVHGETTITTEKDVLGNPIHYNFDDKRMAKSTQSSGSLAEWVRAFKLFEDDTVVHFKCYCVAGSPLLEICGVDNFTIGHIVPTSRGKTTSMEISGSTSGNPTPDDVDSLSLSGEFTESSIEEYLYRHNCGFMGINELSLQKSARITLGQAMEKVTYLHSAGKGKSRSDRGHHNHVEKSWRGINLMNGEDSFTSDTDNVGQSVRFIEIKKPMLNNSDNIISFNTIVKLGRNYGHVFPLYIKKVMEIGEDQIRLDYIKTYKVFKEWLGSGNSKDRLAKSFAVIALSGHYLNMVFADLGIKTHDSIELVKHMVTPYIESNPDESMGLRCARDYISFIHENKLLFNKPDKRPVTAAESGMWETVGWVDDKKKYPGYIRNGFIDHFNQSFKKVIEKELGYNLKTVKDEWYEAGILIANRDSLDFVTSDKENGSECFMRINERKLHEYAGYKSNSETPSYTDASSFIAAYNETHATKLSRKNVEWEFSVHQKESPNPAKDLLAYLESTYAL